MSLAMANKNSKTIKQIPTVWAIVFAFLGILILNTASMTETRTSQPSNTGTGRRFMKNRAMLMEAMKSIVAANPCFVLPPSIVVILAGPLTDSENSAPPFLKIETIHSAYSLVVVAACFAPFKIAR